MPPEVRWGRARPASLSQLIAKYPQALAAQRGYRSFCVPNTFLPSTATALGKDYEKEV
jgi:hypothetical protein